MAWLVLTFTFFMLRYVPGGPYDSERELPVEARAVVQAHYNGEQPLLRQYSNYMRHILSGNLGPSYRQVGWTVKELMADKMPVSFELGLYALVLAVGVGCSLGIFQAVYYGRALDRCLATAEIFLICVPTFVLGPLLHHVFVYKLHWFDAFGWTSWRNKILPVITLALFYAAFLGRLTRHSMRQQHSQLYVRTAYAKGLSPWQVFRRHIFPNGLPAVVAYLGPACAGVLSGTFVVENLFSIPGLGRLFIQAIGNRDYTVISGVLLVYVALIIFFNLISDIILLLLDPRVRASGRV
jgi:oligopeptide transport system permease protein